MQYHCINIIIEYPVDGSCGKEAKHSVDMGNVDTDWYLPACRPLFTLFPRNKL